MFKFNPVPYWSKYYTPISDQSSPENRSIVEVEWFPSNGHFQSDSCKIYHAYGPAFALDLIPADVLRQCRVLAKYKTEGSQRSAENQLQL